MMQNAIVALAMAVALFEVASAQTRPDFSGKWTKVSGPAAPHRTIMHPPDVMTIAQNASTLVMESSSGRRWVFKLDGSDSRNTAPNGDQQVEYVSKANWEGETLTISTPTFNGQILLVPPLEVGPYNLHQSWSLKGGNLVITLTPVSPINPARAVGDDIGTWVYSK